MILRIFKICILGFILNLRVFPIVSGEKINFSEKNIVVENNAFPNESIDNNCTKSENSEENAWFLNIPLLPAVVATSNSIPEGSCRKHLNLYLKYLKNGTLWATEMFDSSAKYPYGIFDGHLRHLGNFDQCLRIHTKILNYKRDQEFEEIRSRYCLVDIKYQEKNEPKNGPEKLDIWFDPQDSAWKSIRERGDFRRYQRHTLQMALCVPASCYPEDIVSALEEPLEKFSRKYNVQVQATIQKDLCQAAHEARKFSTYAKIYCLVFILIVTLVIVSTIYDVKSNEEEKQSLKKELLFCFSARRSLNSIFRVTYRHRGLDCLHVLRTLGIFLVVLAHRRIQDLHVGNVTGRYFEWSIVSPYTRFVYCGTVIVDGFLGIGGLLLSYQFIEFVEKSKRLNIGLIIIKRFFRLAPLYIFVIFAYALILHHLGSGPFWENRLGFDRDSCSTYWWANILFINNYVNGKHSCLLQAWYLAVDFQCFVVGLLILGIFCKLPRKVGYAFLGSFLIMCTAIPFYVTYKYDVDPLFKALGSRRRIEDYHYYIHYYGKTYMRLPAYIVGIIIGAIIYDFRFTTWRLSKIWSQVLFILQIGIIPFFCLYFGYPFMDPNEKPSLFEKALYASLHRPFFAFSVCSVPLLITIGDGLNFYYNFFTRGWCQPISKLSYGIFLLHFVIQSYDVGTARIAFTFSAYHVFTYFFFDVGYTCLLALFFVVMIEEPFKNVGNLLLMGKKSGKSDIKSSETPKKVD